MKILITGAGGFIGSHLAELCHQEGLQVRAFCRYNSRNDWGMLQDLPPAKLRDMEVVSGDLRDIEGVRRAVRGCDVVCHLGALIGIPYSYQNPIDVVHTNVLGSLHVLQASLESNSSKVILTSTSEVYGSAQRVPMEEDHPLYPQSPYAASKVASDMLGLSFFRSYGLAVTLLRPFNTYGPRQSPRAVIPTIVTQALSCSSIRLGRVDPRRDWTYVEDTARGFLAAARVETDACVPIHIGTGREASVAEVVQIVGTIVGKQLSVQEEERRERPPASEVDRLLASNQRAKEILSWEPRVSLETGLERTVEWFRRRADLYKHSHYYV